MTYTKEEIDKYLEILRSYNNAQSEEKANTKVRCRNCQSVSFSIETGYNICDSCGLTNGHVLGYFDLKEYDRFYFRKKSIYQRKYHYEKKVNQVSKRLNLTEEQRYELYNKLMEIDNHIMEILNKKYCRKRMISIFYLIKKLLDQMGCEKSKLVYLKISPQTLANYEKWWNSYKSINHSSVKKSVNNSS